MDVVIHKSISQDLIGKEIEFVPTGTDAASDWLGTVGIVEKLDWEYGSIEIRIIQTSTHKSHIGDTTKFQIGRSWGYVLSQTEWD